MSREVTMIIFEGASDDFIESMKIKLTKAIFGTEFEDAVILLSKDKPKFHKISTDAYDKLEEKLENDK